ncbi:MAG: hypothetical protein EPN40_05600 [Rhodanobacteraceae bacterium]|nr:MAG: hypothetical protein EPN40_05600 [Rhodanobacteraceae bacterium]
MGLVPLTLVEIAQRASVLAAFSMLVGSFLIGVLTMLPWNLRGPEGPGGSLESLARPSYAYHAPVVSV